MKTLINSLLAAFTAYSRIPLPHFKYDPAASRYEICFFPLVGAVTGALWCACGMLIVRLGLSPAAGGAVLTALPIIVTGGIHMDGFLDTSDALASWKEPAECLRILKDPHIGSFALIRGALYILIYFAAATQLCASASGLPRGRAAYVPFIMMALQFALSRELSGLSVLLFPKARKDGMLRSTSDNTAPGAVGILAAELAVTLAAVIVSGILFQKTVQAVFLPVIAALTYAHYYRTAVKRFGGVTGDLAGWFLVRCELFLLVGVVVGTVR